MVRPCPCLCRGVPWARGRARPAGRAWSAPPTQAWPTNDAPALCYIDTSLYCDGSKHQCCILTYIYGFFAYVYDIITTYFFGIVKQLA